MKTISAITVAGALALGIGAFSANAGELKTQGRSGYRVVPDKQDREVTVALYSEEGAPQTTTRSKDEGQRQVIQTQGRAGYRHLVE